MQEEFTWRVCLNFKEERSSWDAFLKIFRSGRTSSMSRSSFRRYCIHARRSERRGIVMILILTWDLHLAQLIAGGDMHKPQKSIGPPSPTFSHLQTIEVCRSIEMSLQVFCEGTTKGHTSSDVGSCLLIAFRSSTDNLLSSISNNDARIWG